MEDTNNDEKNDSLTDKETKKQTEKYITFAKINKYFLIPFLCPVSCMMANFFILLIRESNVIKKGEWVFPIYVELSYVSAGLLHFISYFREKIDDGKDSIVYRERVSVSTRFSFIYNDGNKKASLIVWVIIIFLGFMIAVFELLGAFSLSDHLFEQRLYFMLFIPLFSKLILNENIHKHQYLSLIIAILGIILLIIPVGLKFEKEDLMPNILVFISAVAYSLFLVILKYVNHKYYIPTFKISFYMGIISISLTFLGFLLYSLINNHDFSYFKDSFDFSEVENKLALSIYFILTFIFATALQILTLLVIFYFSPILLMVTDIISPMLFWIAVSIKSGVEMPDVFFYPVGYLIVLFASLIYNEIIIFNFCGLSESTTKFVEIRLNKESMDLRKTQNTLRIGLRPSDLESNSDIEDEEKLSNNS